MGPESETESGAGSEDSVWPGVSLSVGLQVFTFFCPQSLTDSVTSCLDVFILFFVDFLMMATELKCFYKLFLIIDGLLTDA